MLRGWVVGTAVPGCKPAGSDTVMQSLLAVHVHGHESRRQTLCCDWTLGVCSVEEQCKSDT